MLVWSTLLVGTAMALTPAPKEMTVDPDDRFFFRADTVVVLPDAYVDRRIELLAPITDLLDGTLRALPASRLDDVDPALYLATESAPGPLEKRRLRRYRPDDPIPDSGFELSVSDYGVVLVGADETGLWYGLHTLANLAAEYGNNLPYLTIRDWPALAFRGAYLRSLPTESELIRLASLRATHVFVESDDLYDLSGVRADAWARAFDRARELRLEPVPVFSTLDGMAQVLRDNPMLIEGRDVTEAITLNGVEPVSLVHPNVIAEVPEDIFVSISGVPCALGRDYWLEGPPIQAPFLDGGPRWRIWRELEGAIPDGGTVTVAYSYATADSSSLAFASPKARGWLDERLGRLINVLQPRYIHLDHGSVGRFNTDTRSMRAGLSRPQRFVQSLELLASVIRERDPNVNLLMWADLINPRQAAPIYGLGDVAAKLPESIRPMGRITVDAPDTAAERLASVRGAAGRPTWIGLEGAEEAVPVIARGLGSGRGNGIVALSSTPQAMAAHLTYAWQGAAPDQIWVRLLNAYFGASLKEPDHRAVQTALAGHINQKVLAGTAPEAIYEQFEAFVGDNEARLEQNPEGLAQVDRQLRQLTSYLELEARYTREGDAGILRTLQDLVEAVGENDPDGDADRYQQILDTIEGQGLFVPASILFQQDLRYYRPWQFERPLYEVPAQPAYTDTRGQITATLALMRGQAALRRIDFESLGVESLTAVFSKDGTAYETGPRWTAEDTAATLRGPVRVKEDNPAVAVRLAATGSRVPLVMRDLRAFAEKERPVLPVHYAVQAPAMIPEFSGRAWARTHQAGGFLNTATRQFAEAPTAIWATHTREALYLGVVASESRPDAIVADLTGRDAPLWTQESVEIWIQPEGRLPYRLVFSPEGAQFDSEAYDAGWDGDWTVNAQYTDRGWAAVVRIPIALIGPVRPGDAMPLNIVRNRFGAREARSAWAHDYGVQPELQWGTLRFP